jgi:2-oxoglutarate dehydrogenase E2 component (dihydrolipoamide succinyltransferase)
MVQVKVPSVGESIQEVQISQWLKKEGDWVAAGADLVELETEKASVQVPAPVSGVLTKVIKRAEEFAAVGDVLAEMEPSDAPKPPTSGQGPVPVSQTPSNSPQATRVMPAAQRMLGDHALSATQVTATGPGGRLLKEDVAQHVAQATPAKTTPAKTTAAETTAAKATAPAPGPTPTQGTLEIPAPLTPGLSVTATTGRLDQRSETVKPMSMIRRTIATRLVQAQQTAALLTTFNEVDMQPVMQLRTKYRDAFQEKHGVKLGFMSFFAKASCEALRRFPSVNAEIRGNNVVYHNYYDIGIAIGGGKGLVVPVLRNVESMSFASIEKTIGEFARRAIDNKLMPEDLEGGTFTISNGGIYGSMLSTPIVNPPQSAILGLHAIQDRPMAVNGEVVIRPIMYLALTYDHRIIDGREAVTFLKTVKEVIEDPTRLFLEV